MQDDTLPVLRAALARASQAAMRDPFDARLAAEAAAARATYYAELAAQRLGVWLADVELDPADARRLHSIVDDAAVELAKA